MKEHVTSKERAMDSNRLAGMRQLEHNLRAEGHTSRADCVGELCDEIERLQIKLGEEMAVSALHRKQAEDLIRFRNEDAKRHAHEPEGIPQGAVSVVKARDDLRATEETGNDRPAAPISECPTCHQTLSVSYPWDAALNLQVEQKRCGNCGWLGPRRSTQPPPVSNGGMHTTCENCGHYPCSEWCRTQPPPVKQCPGCQRTRDGLRAAAGPASVGLALRARAFVNASERAGRPISQRNFRPANLGSDTNRELPAHPWERRRD